MSSAIPTMLRHLCFPVRVWTERTVEVLKQVAAGVSLKTKSFFYQSYAESFYQVHGASAGGHLGKAGAFVRLPFRCDENIPDGMQQTNDANGGLHRKRRTEFLCLRGLPRGGRKETERFYTDG